MNDIQKRINTLISFLNISKREFERSIGVSPGYIANISRSIQPDKAMRISNQYPEVSIGWLLSGEGEMLKNPSSGEEKDPMGPSRLVPLLPLTAQGGSLLNFADSVRIEDCEQIRSPINDVDFAIAVRGDSMAPEYPNGSQVLIKKINERAFIEWGRTYVLDTCNGSVIKTLVPSEKEGMVRCLSINPSPQYAPFDVSWEDVYGVYRVLMCMSLK